MEVGDESRAALEKLLKRLEKVSTSRNLGAHTIFGLSTIDPETSTWSLRVVPALPAELKAKLESDFVAQFKRAEHDLQAIYKDLEEWLIHTPFPTRLWGSPALLGEPPPYVEPDLTLGNDDPSAWS